MAVKRTNGSIMKYSGKNVLVTGGAGFIGSAIVRELLDEGANVVVLDNMLIGDSSNLEEVKKDIKIVIADVRDPQLSQIMLKNNTDYVFHLAADPYIPQSYERPTQVFEINATGSLNVMLASKEAGVKRILQYSTSEVYGTAKYTPMDEDHPVNPLSTYAVSKLAADRLCFTLYHEQNIPIVTLRQFNCIGPRATQPYVVPELITQLSKSPKVRLGNVKASRDITYVNDAARAALMLMEHSKAEGQVFNCGYGEDVTVEELAHTIGEIMGHQKVEILIDPKKLRPVDVLRLQCDYTRLHMLTGWKPEATVRESLEMTVDWFKENGSKWVWESKIEPTGKHLEIPKN